MNASACRKNGGPLGHLTGALALNLARAHRKSARELSNPYSGEDKRMARNYYFIAWHLGEKLLRK